jgi:hypothetical protein
MVTAPLREARKSAYGLRMDCVWTAYDICEGEEELEGALLPNETTHRD